MKKLVGGSQKCDTQPLMGLMKTHEGDRAQKCTKQENLGTVNPSAGWARVHVEERTQGHEAFARKNLVSTTSGTTVEFLCKDDLNHIGGLHADTVTSRM